LGGVGLDWVMWLTMTKLTNRKRDDDDDVAGKKKRVKV
jgi:hypothetical protein